MIPIHNYLFISISSYVNYFGKRKRHLHFYLIRNSLFWKKERNLCVHLEHGEEVNRVRLSLFLSQNTPITTLFHLPRLFSIKKYLTMEDWQILCHTQWLENIVSYPMKNRMGRKQIDVADPWVKKKVINTKHIADFYNCLQTWHRCLSMHYE